MLCRLNHQSPTTINIINNHNITHHSSEVYRLLRLLPLLLITFHLLTIRSSSTCPRPLISR
jgi:hypothetical protein